MVIGGDGTISESVNGIFSFPPALRESVTLAVISTGTGCGLARSLGLPGTIRDQIAVACNPHTRAIDLGRLHFAKGNRTLFFINECQIGIGAEVVGRTGHGSKSLGGPLAYVLATVPLLFTYPNPPVDVTLEASATRSLEVTGISIGNGAITGGGMRLTPHAVPDDGLLDVLVMKGQSPLRRAASFARVRSGNHLRSPEFEYHQVRRITISSPSPLRVAADGEVAGSLPATFTVLPQVMPVHCPIQQPGEALHEHVISAA